MICCSIIHQSVNAPLPPAADDANAHRTRLHPTITSHESNNIHNNRHHHNDHEIHAQTKHHCDLSHHNNSHHHQHHNQENNVKSAVYALSSTSSSFGTAAASGRFDAHGNGIDDAVKAQALAEEEAAMNQYRVSSRVVVAGGRV